MLGPRHPPGVATYRRRAGRAGHTTRLAGYGQSQPTRPTCPPSRYKPVAGQAGLETPTHHFVAFGVTGRIDVLDPRHRVSMWARLPATCPTACTPVVPDHAGQRSRTRGNRSGLGRDGQQTDCRSLRSAWISRSEGSNQVADWALRAGSERRRDLVHPVVGPGADRVYPTPGGARSGPSFLIADRREPAPAGRASSGRSGRDHHRLVQCPASLRGDLLPRPDDIVFELGLR